MVRIMIRRGVSKYELWWALGEVRRVVRAKRSRYVGLRDFKGPKRTHVVIGHLLSILEMEGVCRAIRNGRPLKYEFKPLSLEALVRCEEPSGKCKACSLRRYCPYYKLHLLLET